MNTTNELADFDVYKVASILACLPRHIRMPVIEQLKRSQPNIGHMALRFEDLIHLDEQGIKLLLKQADYHDLTLSLVTASNNLRQHFYDNIGQNLKNDINQLISAACHGGPIQRVSLKSDHNIALNNDINDLEKLAELELDSLDAQMLIINLTAKLRQSKQLQINPPGFHPEYVNEAMIHGISDELQLACEKAMAQVLSHHMPEAAAAVLCRRLDRSQILSQMLKLDDIEHFDPLNALEVKYLLSTLLGMEEKD